MWHGIQPTERRLLFEQLEEARSARRQTPGWAAVVAVVLAVMFGHYYLAAGFLALGVVAEVVRQWRISRTIRGVWRALRDPMDGS